MLMLHVPHFAVFIEVCHPNIKLSKTDKKTLYIIASKAFGRYVAVRTLDRFLSWFLRGRKMPGFRVKVITDYIQDLLGLVEEEPADTTMLVLKDLIIFTIPAFISIMDMSFMLKILLKNKVKRSNVNLMLFVYVFVNLASSLIIVIPNRITTTVKNVVKRLGEKMGMKMEDTDKNE